jgi:GNAT superfamily N-acetyltransferase
MEGPIDVPLDTTAAFVGCALRGPLNTPVAISSFAAFRRHFGGIWQRSSLAPAVQQYFDHGGRKLYVVRVANDARGAMICLPAKGGVLVLHALEPGSTEIIRAAVDYDGVDEQRFNLTIQRVSPDSGLVADQEIYRQLTCQDGERDFIGDELLNSSIVRAQLPTPKGRPAKTEHGYVADAQRGSDGQVLTDYDLVGCKIRSTGIFALNAMEHFELLHIPPPARDQDLGPAAVLAAEQYCRKRGAMLVLDPPRAWRSVRKAIEGVREAGYSSPNIVTYFPRVYSKKDRGSPPRAVGGAIAGLLCMLDKKLGPWEDLDQVGYGLSSDLVPVTDVSVDDAQMLVKEGINVIAGGAAGRANLCGSVTLARGGQMDGKFSILTVRRLCLEITNTIDHGTQWTTFAPNTALVAEKVDGLVHAYMCSLADAGAFADDVFVVKCDAGLHSSPVNKNRGITILLAFHPVGSDEPVSLTLHQTISGCRVATTAFAPVIEKCA